MAYGRWAVTSFFALSILIILAGGAFATTWTVGPTGCDYTSIQAAINAVTTVPGDTIEVYCGTYYENVLVKKRLTLRGIGSPVVDAGGSGIAIFLGAEGCILDGFVATNGTNGILIAKKDNTVSGNTANGNGNGIILNSAGSGSTVSGNTATNNNGAGIYLFHPTGITVSGNTANGNGNGIDLVYSNDNTVSGNTANGNDIYDISLEGTCINNIICLNSFNTASSSNLKGENRWNTTEPVTYVYNGKTFTNYLGNRWSNYTGYDTNDDGIGDTPYSISGGSEMDNYPLTSKNGGINATIAKTADPPGGVPSTEVPFTIEVDNTGMIGFDDLTVQDELPEGLEYVSSTPSGTFYEGNKSVVWSLGTLAAESSRSVELLARIDGSKFGELENRASFVGTNSSYGSVRGNASETVSVQTGIGVNKTADKTEYERGEEITYTIVITNPFSFPIRDVVVRDVFDRQVEFVYADPAPDADGIWRFDSIPAGGSVTITLVVRVPKQEFEFDMGSGVSGTGFVNVADDYSTTLQPYSITNRVYVTSMSTIGEFSDSETVSVLADPGTELETREHGSGVYDGDELVEVRTENKSISMEKDVAATYAPTTLGLYNNRTVAYSSKWTEAARAKNRVTGASMSEQYRYATTIDRESWIFMDENESVMEVSSEFDGMGHIGFLKMPPNSTHHTTPIFESREDYIGSFRVLEATDEYGSSVSSERSASGSGFAVVDRRVGESQRSYESGTGTYDAEELIETYTNYIAKDISLEYAPAAVGLTDDVSINSSLKWKEGMYSKTAGTSYIGEEYTSIAELDKETVARGLNEMDTEAEFSGMARYRAVLERNGTEPEVDFDESYTGDYSVERRVIFTGVPKYDRPHLNVTKTLDGIVEETLPWGYGEEHLEGETKTRDVATYTITIENDGNRALGPVYVQDLFPPGSAYIEASVRPTEIAETYANWTLMNIGIGDAVGIELKLDVSEYSPSELVNRVEVCGGINNGDDWICASNFSALEIDWLTCCPSGPVAVETSADVDETNNSVARYRIEIKSLEDATRVATVTDWLPEGMELLESSIPFASYEDGVVVWNLVEIPASGTAEIEFSALAPSSGRFTNTVEVDARSVDGPVVQPISATCVIDVGLVEECGTVSCDSWQPPNWEFEHRGRGPDQTTCEDLTCASCDGTDSCLAP